MKHWQECTRLHTVNEQVFAHVFLAGVLCVANLIVYAAEPSLSAGPVLVWIIATFSIAFFLLATTNRITYIDDSKETIEVRSIVLYWLCYRRRSISPKDLLHLTLVTITDADGDKSYRLEMEVAEVVQRSLVKPTPPLRIVIQYARDLAPILKSAERLSKLFGTKLVRIP